MFLEKNIRDTKQAACLSMLIVAYILSTNGFNYSGWDNTLAGNLIKLLSVILIGYCIVVYNADKNRNFGWVIITLFTIPLLSNISTYILYGQDFIRGCISSLVVHSYWLLYFVLHKLRAKEQTILTFFFIISLIIVFLQIFQITFPDIAMFGIADEETMQLRNMEQNTEIRNGIQRFLVHDNAYTCVFIVLFIISYAKNFEYKKWFPYTIILFAVSVYLTLTRQVMLAFIVVSFLLAVGGAKSIFKTKAILYGIAICLLLIIGYNVLFAGFADKMEEELSDDYVRLLSAGYYGTEIFTNPITIILGHGTPDSQSAYAAEMEYLNQDLGFYAEDVGWIGMAYQYGMLYVVIGIYFMYLIIYKYRKTVPAHIKYFVLYAILMSLMILPIGMPYYNLLWATIAYMADLHINRSALAIPCSEKEKKISILTRILLLKKQLKNQEQEKKNLQVVDENRLQ